MHDFGFDVEPSKKTVNGTSEKIWIWTIYYKYFFNVKFPDKVVEYIKNI